MADYDLIAIGGGTAGLVASAGAATLGARTALIEQNRLGGECLWTGCVPSKALLAAARAAAALQQAHHFGIRGADAHIDFPAVMAWVRSAQRKIEPHDSPERFRSLGVDVIEGAARFAGERTLAVAERRMTGRHIVIATGSKPALPPIDGLAATPHHTNETIFDLPAQPRSLIVLGGGAVGLELGQAFALLGTKVTVIESAAQILPREDHELAAQLAQLLRQVGVDLRLGTRATQARAADAGVALTTETGATLHAEVLLVATGRTPNIGTFDPGAGGVATKNGELVLDSYLRTSARNVWAAGDVTGAPRFTHVADYQARLVLRNALFPFAHRARYDQVPWVVFTDPELAHVGLTEAEARDRHGDKVHVWRRAFGEVDRATTEGRAHGMVKLIADRRGRLLGGHILGHAASSLIGELAIALRHGISVGQIADTIHAYPTYPEAIRQAAEQRTRARFTGLVRRAAGWWVRG